MNETHFEFIYILIAGILCTLFPSIWIGFGYWASQKPYEEKGETE